MRGSRHSLEAVKGWIWRAINDSPSENGDQTHDIESPTLGVIATNRKPLHLSRERDLENWCLPGIKNKGEKYCKSDGKSNMGPKPPMHVVGDREAISVLG